MRKFSEITSSVQLNLLLKVLYPKFDTHVIPSDFVNEIEPKMNQIIIINFDKSYGSGTHWVCTIINNQRWAIYYDSYAVDPPDVVLNYLRRAKKIGLVKDIIMTTNEIQTFKEDWCGWACLAFIDHIVNWNQPPWDAGNTLDGAKILKYGKQLFKKYLSKI